MSTLIPWRSCFWTRETSSPDAAFADSVLRWPPTEVQQLAVVGCDNSGSTHSSGAMEVLRKATPKFIEDLCRDPATRSSLLATFSVFNDSDSWNITAPFCPVLELVPPQFSPTGSTPWCKRVIESIKLLSARRQLVRSLFKVDQRHAWLVEATDGYFSDCERLDEARHAIQVAAVEAGIEVYLFGMGEGANMSLLQSLAQPERPAELLRSDRDFAALFKWVSTSLKITSQSIAGQIIEIPSITGQLIRTE